jgi:hypothetical protein
MLRKTIAHSSQVKLLITNNAFCIVQRATAQSKTGIFRHFGVAEAPPGFKRPLHSSQVKLLITNNAFCIVQRATTQSKTGMFRDYGEAEAPPFATIIICQPLKAPCH